MIWKIGLLIANADRIARSAERIVRLAERSYLAVEPVIKAEFDYIKEEIRREREITIDDLLDQKVRERKEREND